MIGLGLGITIGQGGRAGGLTLSVAARGADGTTATINIGGTLSQQVQARGADGTTATLRII